jgi:hypothetical protein
MPMTREEMKEIRGSCQRIWTLTGSHEEKDEILKILDVLQEVEGR